MKLKDIVEDMLGSNSFVSLGLFAVGFSIIYSIWTDIFIGKIVASALVSIWFLMWMFTIWRVGE